MKVIKPLIFSRSGFTRESEARYYNSSGILTTAGVDELRIGYNPSTLEYIGPIYENEQDNLFTASNEFTNSLWFKPGVTLTPNAAISPDGTMNATLFQPGDEMGQEYIPRPGVGIKYVAFSIYIKPVTPAPYPNSTNAFFTMLTKFHTGGYYNASFRFYSDHAPQVIKGSTLPAPGSDAVLETLPNGWYRATVYGTGYADYGTIDSGGNFYIYEAMAEVITGSFTGPSSHIHSSSSTYGHRAQDVFEGTPPLVISSTVLENDAPVWDSGDTYAPGDRAMVLGDYHRVYEAQASTTNQFPPSNLGSVWLDTGPTNRFKMFDMSTGAENQTVANDGNNISVSVGVQGRVNALVLLNVDADRVRILIRDDMGNVIKEELIYLMGEPLQVGWYDWWFGARGEDDLIIYEDFSFVEGQTGNIEVIAESDEGPAAIGKMIVGDAIQIGCAKFNSSGGIIDFSRKERDAFGNNTVVQRRYIDKFEYDVIADTTALYDIKNLLASIRATPAVYIGSNNQLITVVFGFYRDFNIVLSNPKVSNIAIQAEGI